MWWRLQGKLQGRLLEHSTPQPIDECLAILGDAIVRQNSLSPVMSVFAKAVKDGDVRPFQPLFEFHWTRRTSFLKIR